MSTDGDINSKSTSNIETLPISLDDLRRVLRGVVAATGCSSHDEKSASDYLSTILLTPKDEEAAHSRSEVSADEHLERISFQQWCDWIKSDPSRGLSRQLVLITLAVAFLRKLSRGNFVATTLDIESIWTVVRTALTDSQPGRLLCSTSRSAQGYVAVPLCTLIEDGKVNELFRLNVWLPDGQRGNPDCAIHSHQPFAQSWILAGEGRDYIYDVERTSDTGLATHAEYALSWKDERNSSNHFNTYQTYSAIDNTNQLVRVTERNSARYGRNQSYCIPAGAFHRTDVLPDNFHATMFFFDSHREYKYDARVLGSITGDSSVHFGNVYDITSLQIVQMIDAFRSWESFLKQGKLYAQRAEWEFALRSFNDALNICQIAETFPNRRHYTCLTLGELGVINRCFGRYAQAKDVLEEAVRQMDTPEQRLDISGELGVVYQQMNQLDDARRAFETQYNTAKQLKASRATCRAIGNMGMVNYQSFQQTGDRKLLETAIAQLNERINRAQKIQRETESMNMDAVTKARRMQNATTWEAIGLARLSLCFGSQGRAAEAIHLALQSLQITAHSEDATVVALSRFYYGHALLLDGQQEKAIEQFNKNTGCTSVIALCKEPSEENRRYIRELRDAGADMDVVDGDGYSALDYAVFSGSDETVQIVLEALRSKDGQQSLSKVDDMLREANLRKGYREIFQEQLRPVLKDTRQALDLQHLRAVYADFLVVNKSRHSLFDRLRFVRYSEFRSFGRIPRSSEAQLEEFLPGTQVDDKSGFDFVIFFSYRWMNAGSLTPDDVHNTQYHRMVDAIEQLLKLQPNINPDRVKIWVDYACVNQEMLLSGVAALPMIVAQCNALISLMDDSYYDRAWCCVEALMIQTLRRSYNFHLWYEQVPSPERQGGKEWTLREGPIDMEITMADKGLSYEQDRPKVLFLERQTKLMA